MKIEVGFRKKYSFALFALLLVVAGLVTVFAYNANFNSPASSAVNVGHSADEVVVRMSDGSLRTVQELLSSGAGSSGGSTQTLGYYNRTGHLTWTQLLTTQEATLSEPSRTGDGFQTRTIVKTLTRPVVALNISTRNFDDAGFCLVYVPGYLSAFVGYFSYPNYLYSAANAPDESTWFTPRTHDTAINYPYSYPIYLDGGGSFVLRESNLVDRGWAPLQQGKSIPIGLSHIPAGTPVRVTQHFYNNGGPGIVDCQVSVVYA